MRRNLPLLLLGAACWGASLGHAAPITSLHATARMSQASRGQKPTSMSTEVWMKGSKMRAQIGDRVQIIDGTNLYMYSLKDPQKRVLVGPAPPQAKATSIAQRLQQMVPQHATRKKIGTARMLNYPTTIYQITLPDGKQTLKAWEATISGAAIPLKVVAQSPVGTMGNEVTSIQINPNLPDRLFAPPAGYKRISMSSRPPMPPGVAPVRPKATKP